MRTLLSIPENLTRAFHELTQTDIADFFVASDPPDGKIGSGGGTAYLLEQDWKKSDHAIFDKYINGNKRIIIHAGGQSRRLPAYAPSGKFLTPIPVFRWSQGQRLDQTLLDLQLPLYQSIMKSAHRDSNTLIASGDTLIIAPQLPYAIPKADVVCFSIWVDPHLASKHGVFFTRRAQQEKLDFMLQKPSPDKIEALTKSHLFQMDIGIWLLSDRALSVLMEKCGWKNDCFQQGIPDYYDMYSTFGACLGINPKSKDPSVSELSVAIVPLDGGEFYHYGTSLELITSTVKIQNRIQDQRAIWHHRVKPHPSIFVHNADTAIKWKDGNHHIWIENSYIPDSWTLSDHHVITGVPENNWKLSLPPGVCLDIVPVDDHKFCIRPYGITDAFRGHPAEQSTTLMGVPLQQWLGDRRLDFAAGAIAHADDIFNAPLFPIASKEELTEPLVKGLLHPGDADEAFRQLWTNLPRISAEEISIRANLKRLFDQRNNFRYRNLQQLAANYQHSVFYQVDLKHAASDFVSAQLELADPLPVDESPMIRMRDHMFRSEVLKHRSGNGQHEEDQAFEVLRHAILETTDRSVKPRLNIYKDQIVWGRSPVRLDLAGGWSDTPPLCMQHGGTVLNLAVNLNGQPPLQVFIRLSEDHKIILRSIDNGVSEEVNSFEELKGFNNVGSAFSIPKAALCLAGFHPEFSDFNYATLAEQLKAFGGGFEISLLAAVPKGSGLGTSSILAATILGTLSDFCNLDWDHQQICHRTLILEQLLTTGGGWQDQYGGILPGIKLLESQPGTQETMRISWLPDQLFNLPEFKVNWLLYYTGITRIAKNILADIVRGMFLNEGSRLRILNEIKQHAYRTAEAIQKCDFHQAGRMVAHSWHLNNTLDQGTNTREVQSIIDKIDNYALGFKLLGAGGGGYMLICAKDEPSAVKIQSILNENSPNEKARFVKMELSKIGFQVSRS